MTYIPLPTGPGGELRVGEVNPPETKYIGPEALIAAAQNFTLTPWVDLGGEIPTAGCTHLGVWLKLLIGTGGVDMRVRALLKHTIAHADEFPGQIRVLSATDIKVQPGYIECDTDADQNLLLSIPLDGHVPFVQIQIMCGTVGAPPCNVASAYTTKAWSGAGGGF